MRQELVQAGSGAARDPCRNRRSIGRAELGELPIAEAGKAKAQHGGDVAGVGSGLQGDRRQQIRSLDLDWPQRHGQAGAHADHGTVVAVSEQGRTGGHGEAAQGACLTRIGRERCDGHRRDGCDQAGLHDLEQRPGDLGRLRLVQALQAGGEKGERFDQSLDMGVRRAAGVEREPPGDLRIAAGEGGPAPREVGQLGQIVRQQLLGRLNPHLRRPARRPARTRSSPGARRLPARSRPRSAPTSASARPDARSIDHRGRAQARLPELDGARQMPGERRPGVGVGRREQRQVGDAIIHDGDRPPLQRAGRRRRAGVEQPLELARDRLGRRGSGRPAAADGSGGARRSNRRSATRTEQAASRPRPGSGDFLGDQVVRDRLHPSPVPSVSFCGM